MERVDPLAVFGRPWSKLEASEQIELLAYATLREAEEAAEERAVGEAYAVRKRKGRR